MRPSREDKRKGGEPGPAGLGWFPRSLDRRLAWVLTGVLPLLGFGIVMLLLFTHQQEQAIERLLRETAGSSSLLVDRGVREQIGLMEGMAASLAFDRGDLVTVRSEAQRLWQMHPEWRTVIVTDEHRPLVNLRFPPDAPMTPLRDPASLARVWSTGRPVVGNLVSDYVGFRVPVSLNGRMAYTIAIPVDPQFFRDILVKHRLTQSWSAAVIGSDRIVIAATSGAPLKEGQPLPQKLAPADGLRAAETDYLAWAPVGDSGWNVLIVAPAAAVEQPFVRARTGVIVGGAGSAVLTAILVVFLSSAWSARREAAGLKSEIREREQAEQALRESEERLRTFGGATFEGIVFSEGGRVVDCNDQFARILGYERHELVGRDMVELVAPEAREHVRQNFATNRQDVVEHEVTRRDGTRITVEANGSPLQPEGRMRCTAIRDVSERRKKELALHESEERFRKFAENAYEGIWALDADQRVTFVNQRLADILGCTIADMIGRPGSDFIFTEDLPDHRAKIEERRKGERSNYERRMARRDGSPIWVLISAVPILDAKGGFAGSFGMFTDNTERKAAEQAIRESEERFRLTFDASPDAININRLEDGLYVAVNQGFTDLTGWGREEVIGRTSAEISMWHDPDDRRRLIERLNTTGSCDNLQAQFRRKDGNLTTALMSARAISLNGTGHIVSITRDISKRIEDETALKESEERYRQVVDIVPDAISIFVDEKFVFANRRGMAMIGAADFDTLRGRPIWDVCHPRDVSRGKERYHECLHGGHPLPPVEFELVGFDGRSLCVESSAVPIQYRGSQALLAVWRDITARKRVESAVRENEELFRGTFDFSPIGQTIADLDYRYLRCNEAFCRFLGYTEGELVGRNLFEVTHPDDRSVRSVTRDLVTGKSDRARFQKRYIRRDGDVVWGDVTVRLVLSPEGTPRHLLSVVQDITEKVRDAEQKEKLEAQLRQAQKMEALGTLAGGIAHDFNNILGVIIGGSEMLELTDAARASSQETLANVLGASHRAKDLVKQILAFSRHTKQEKILLNLKPIIKETIDFMRASLPSAIQLRHFIDPASGAVVADPTQMQQVLMNLCTNAAHAMEKEGGILQVRLATIVLDAGGVSFDADLKPGRYTRLTVSDTGHGIEPAVMQRIFEPYFTTKEKGKGTGLGLAVVHGIVKAHNGAITVASEPGAGATFEVFLPCVEGQAGEGDTNAAEPLPTGSERILLVDDEQALVETERQILGLLGYHVEAVTNPLDAIAAFHGAPHAFDLVLTDMTMPNMSGMKMARRMMEIRPDLPVIICTGFSDQINPQQAHAAGIKALLMKPLMARELAQAIRRALTK